MSDLIAFLTATLDEDERVAREAAVPSRSESWEITDGQREQWHTGLAIAVAYSVWDACIDPRTAKHTARHDPARVLADVAAKRAIVALHSEPIHDHIRWADAADQAEAAKSGDLWCRTCGSVDDSPVPWPCRTVVALAQPYADRPGFDPAWKLEEAYE